MRSNVKSIKRIRAHSIMLQIFTQKRSVVVVAPKKWASLSGNLDWQLPLFACRHFAYQICIRVSLTLGHPCEPQQVVWKLHAVFHANPWTRYNKTNHWKQSQHMCMRCTSWMNEQCKYQQRAVNEFEQRRKQLQLRPHSANRYGILIIPNGVQRHSTESTLHGELQSVPFSLAWNVDTDKWQRC